MFAKFKELREEREGGFTLIELLVVILIIGILAAIAIPMFLNQRKSAVDSSIQSDVKNAATQVETWMVKNPSTAVPTESIVVTSAGAATLSTGIAALKDAKVGNGTTLKLAPNASNTGAYTICAFNAGGDQGDGSGAAGSKKVFIYDSSNGGLKAITNGTC